MKTLPFASVALALALSACGGGGGGNVTTGSTCTPFNDSFNRQVSCADMQSLAGADLGFLEGGGDGAGGAGDGGADGAGADGAPIANMDLQFTDINGKTVRTKTDANGYYRISLRGLKAPLVATVLRADKPWKSMLVEDIVRAPARRQFYTINLTGLTDVVASNVAVSANLAGSNQLTPAVIAAKKENVAIAIASVNAQIESKLREANLPTNTNPLTFAFVPNSQGYDRVLDSVLVTQTPNGPTQLALKYSVGGTLGGSAGRAGLVLSNGTDRLQLPDSTATQFEMPVTLLPGTRYDIQVAAQPTGATCTVNNGAGVMGTTNITSVSVLCSGTTYSLGGTISGLGNVSGLSLSVGNQTLAINPGASTFTFSSGLPAGATYAVSVASQPTGATCSVSSGSGTIAAANISGVLVTCSSTSATLGGNVTGLGPFGQTLVLAAGGQTVTVNGTPANLSDVPFTFPSPFAFGTAYNVTVQSQPAGQTCTVSSGVGNIGNANTTSVQVNCSNTATFTLGGNALNLYNNGMVLATNGQTVNVSPSACVALACVASFQFPTTLPIGANYSVTVQTQPTDQTCIVSNGTGTIGSANINSVTVTCSNPNTYTLGGTVTGLTENGLVLSTNGQTVTVNRSAVVCSPQPCALPKNFTFPIPLQNGTNYSLTVQNQPPWQSCTVSNGNGTLTSSTNSLSVNCSEKLSLECKSALQSSASYADSAPILNSFAIILHAEPANSDRAITVAGNLNTLFGKSRTAVTTDTYAPPGCIGYRSDIGGTAVGAQCLASFLGTPYYVGQCAGDGFPYNFHLSP